MRRMLLCAASALVAFAPRAGDGAGVDPARIAADPEAYVGKAVTVEVEFVRIDAGREPWEEQGSLKTSRVVKFTVAPFGQINCYAARTEPNVDALAGLKKGRGLVLAGVLRKHRPTVKATVDVKGGRRRGPREIETTERGAARYVFMVESVERAERGGAEKGGGR